MPIDVTLMTDPGCPWGYSATPALTLMRWRYGDQLRWRLVTIGLTERAEQYEERGYTPLMMALSAQDFRRYGMPFAPQQKERVAATARACRAAVATRLFQPEHEWPTLRALQLAQFTTPIVLDDDEQLLEPLSGISCLDAARVVAALDDPEVTADYERDRAEARTAAGSPTELQGKTAETDGAVRYTAPSLVFTAGERRLEAGGFQPAEFYDALIANLDPTLECTPPPEGVDDVMARFPGGLVTQEVAAIMAEGNAAPDRRAAEAALIELGAQRTALGDDALWSPARVPTAV